MNANNITDSMINDGNSDNHSNSFNFEICYQESFHRDLPERLTNIYEIIEVSTKRMNNIKNQLDKEAYEKWVCLAKN